MAEELKQYRVGIQASPTPVGTGARVTGIAEEALSLFLEKNQGYGDTAYNLGAKGQYADMNRKMGKLKHTLWDGNPVVGESVEEMLMDLFGHVLLTIDFLREGNR